MTNEESQVMDISEAPREALLEIIESLQGRVNELESKGPDIPPGNDDYLEFDLKSLGTFKMRSQTSSNLELFTNALAFITAVKPQLKASFEAKAGDII